MDAFISRWSVEDQCIDRAYIPNEIAIKRLTKGFMVRLATKGEVIRETDRISTLERKRVAEVEKQVKGHVNHAQIMQGLAFQAKMALKRREVFLRYFSIPKTLVYWFEDREIGIVGWAVYHENRLARTLNMKAELFLEE